MNFLETGFRDKLVLVTGAGSGIGRATALAFAARGAKLVVCDINRENLEAVADEIAGLSISPVVEVVDVANREAMRAFAENVLTHHGAPDVLVNNAGVAMGASFLDTRLEDWDWLLGINLFGVIHGCHFFLPKMAKRGSGHVVNVSSALGYHIAPNIIAYITSKFAVLGLSESLREELRPKGIGVSVICPGVINTNIVKETRYQFGEFDAEKIRADILRTYKVRNYGPERVAEAIVSAVERNRAVVPVSPEAWVLYYLRRFTPKLSILATRLLNLRLRRFRRL